MRLRYEGPGHRLEAFGKIVARGDEATFTDDQVATLLAQPYVRFSINGVMHTPPLATPARRGFDPVASRPSVYGSRRQWSAYAAKQDVAVTDGMTRDEIIAAVDAPPPGAGEPEALTGEGHSHHDEKEN